MQAYAVVDCNGDGRGEASVTLRRFLIACINHFPREKDMADETKSTMDASKENARRASEILTTEVDTPIFGNEVQRGFTIEQWDFLVAFVAAAEKRLPGQQAIDRDKKRKRAAAKDLNGLRKPKAKPARG